MDHLIQTYGSYGSLLTSIRNDGKLRAMRKRLITSALPYVNNIPHLGNLIQVLSGDVFARYCRSRGIETLYICGTDEYGTATETKALEEGITPKQLCDQYYDIHTDIYRWFDIAFDDFGRTSRAEHTAITQDIFKKLDQNGYIKEKTIEQTFCRECDRFLADRYVRGVCPSCSYAEARGDQCEACGKLLDPVELIEPRCSVCGHTPTVRETNHLYIDLPTILPRLQDWMDTASRDGYWARNAIRMTHAWIRDGLKERCITRDLRWGIPVPKPGYEGKVFYVWFDAPIGYISMSAHINEQWEDWWRNPNEVSLYQFIGKDNIPFHTVIFPCSLIGTGETWTLLFHIASTEYLNYESGKFSKSKGVGVFGTDAKQTQIPADVWRFYIFYNRPEKSDSLFTWKDFQVKVNAELIGNLSNLINRTLTFVTRYYDGKVPSSHKDESFWKQVTAIEQDIEQRLERVELKDALHLILLLSSIGNKKFQDEEPWRTVKQEPARAASCIWNLCHLIRDLAILMQPYLPQTAKRVAAFLGGQRLVWADLRVLDRIETISNPELLFSRLEDVEIQRLRERFSGSQAERKTMNAATDFMRRVELRVARIVGIKRHSKADRLYIETVDLGGEERQIVSGLVPFYEEAELLGRNIVLVTNLKSAKLRGVESRGMLLAAKSGDVVEVIFADQAEIGERVGLEDWQPSEPGADEITIEEFFQTPIIVRDKKVCLGEKALTVSGQQIETTQVESGTVE